MAKASDNLFPKVILEERLSDGSDTGNPATDHRALFLGEDGALHLRDSSGTITAIGGGGGGGVTVADEGGALSTAGTTLNFVGAGVTASGTGATKTITIPGGSGGASVPVIVQAKDGAFGNSLGGSITLAQAPASGNSLIMGISESNGTGPSAVSSSNTTWTKIAGITQGFSVWVGVVSGTGGTTITLSGLGTYSFATVLEVEKTLTPTLAHGGNTDFGDVTTVAAFRISGLTAGNLVVAAVCGRGAAGGIHALSAVNPVMVGHTRGRLPLLVGYAATTHATVSVVEADNWYVVFLGEIT